jgi:hypothetical protein
MRRLRRGLTHFRTVSPADVRRFLAAVGGRRRWSACRAVLDGAFVTAVLKRRGLRPLLRDRSDLPVATPDQAAPFVEAVDAALGMLPAQPTCLRRSVTLLRAMHREELGATLHIGVRHGANGIEAHAWVQAGQHVVNDDPGLVAGYVQLSVGEAERYLPRLA